MSRGPRFAAAAGRLPAAQLKGRNCSKAIFSPQEGPSVDDSGIENVADTAFLVAHYRAAESARADALFQDPLASGLAGEHGRRLAQSWPTGRLLAWTVALRTVIIDDYIHAA